MLLAAQAAFLVEPTLLVLDEPTSALDAGTEVEVQAGLSELMSGRTTLVVTHRLSTVRGAQRIVVLADGVVAESGTHDELAAKGGVYVGRGEVGDAATSRPRSGRPMNGTAPRPMKRIKLRSPARAEIRAAMRSDESRQMGLGLEFIH